MFVASMPDGETYEVNFEHTKDRKGRRATVCHVDRILGIDDEGHRVNYTASYGVAVCGKHDNFCKATGRKLSMKDALDRFTREERTAFWNAYWKTLGVQTYVNAI